MRSSFENGLLQVLRKLYEGNGNPPALVGTLGAALDSACLCIGPVQNRWVVLAPQLLQELPMMKI